MCADFNRRLDAKKVQREIVTELGIAGFLARAFVFAMIGLFLLFAAVNSRSNEAKGFAGSLQVIQHQPTGQSCLPLLRQGCSLSASTESLRELTAGSLRLDCLLYSRSTLVCGYCVIGRLGLVFGHCLLPLMNKISGQFRQSVVSSCGPSIFTRSVASIPVRLEVDGIYRRQECYDCP